MSGFHANFWTDIFRRHSHSTSAYKEKALLVVQPLQINIPSLHIFRPRKGWKAKRFFSKIKKYLEFIASFGISLCLVYHVQKTLKNCSTLSWKNYVLREKKKKLNTEFKIKQVETIKKVSWLKIKRSNLKLKWNQQKKSHWFWWTWAFYKVSHHVPGSTKCVAPYAC